MRKKWLTMFTNKSLNSMRFVVSNYLLTTTMRFSVHAAQAMCLFLTSLLTNWLNFAIFWEILLIKFWITIYSQKDWGQRNSKRKELLKILKLSSQAFKISWWQHDLLNKKLWSRWFLKTSLWLHQLFILNLQHEEDQIE